MFSCLNPEELSIVIDAMQKVTKKTGEVIIKEGDDGDNLYVVESGVLTCTKHFVRFSTYLKHQFRKEMLNPRSLKSTTQVRHSESSPCCIMLQELPPLPLRLIQSCGHLIVPPLAILSKMLHKRRETSTKIS